jgi:hypothetical protein
MKRVKLSSPPHPTNYFPDCFSPFTFQVWVKDQDDG